MIFLKCLTEVNFISQVTNNVTRLLKCLIMAASEIVNINHINNYM